MADKRMISKTIIDSDIFLDMPQSTQLLYFHLNLRADDEGFIDSPKKVMRIVGSNQNDLDILLVKRYLLKFPSGVMVVKHWKLHNTIRKDRMKETIYTEEKNMLLEKVNGVYTDNATLCQPVVNQLTDKVSPSIDKIRLEENSIDKINKTKKEPKKKYGEYKKVLLTDTQYNSLLTDWGLEELNRMIRLLDESMEMNPKYKYSNFKIALTKWKNNSFNSPTNQKVDKWKGEQNFEL
jgi:hypothetical protein